MKHWMWVLELKLCSSGRPIHAFNLCGIFPGPNLCLFCCSLSLFSNNTEVNNMTWDIVSWMLIFLLVCNCFYKSERSGSESGTHSLEIQIINANDLKKRFWQLFPLPNKLWNILLPVCTKFSSVLLYCKGILVQLKYFWIIFLFNCSKHFFLSCVLSRKIPGGDWAELK